MNSRRAAICVTAITLHFLSYNMYAPVQNEAILQLRVDKTHATAYTALGAMTSMTVADQFNCDNQTRIALFTTSDAKICDAPPSFQRLFLMQLRHLHVSLPLAHTHNERQFAMTLNYSSSAMRRTSIIGHELSFLSYVQQTSETTQNYRYSATCVKKFAPSFVRDD